MRPSASTPSIPSASVDALDTSDDASGTTVVPQAARRVALLLNE